MVVIDSSAWIEYFRNGARSHLLVDHFKNPAQIVTPTIVLFEVYKKLKKDRPQQDALEEVSQMLNTNVVPLFENISLSAADIGLEHNISMADAIIYATALEYGCRVVTLDADFSKLPQEH